MQQTKIKNKKYTTGLLINATEEINATVFIIIWLYDRGISNFLVLYIKSNKKVIDMKTVERENQTPMLWYWNIPENGMNMEDCEKIAKENLANRQKNKYMDMHIAFV